LLVTQLLYQMHIIRMLVVSKKNITRILVNFLRVKYVFDPYKIENF